MSLEIFKALDVPPQPTGIENLSEFTDVSWNPAAQAAFPLFGPRHREPP